MDSKEKIIQHIKRNGPSQPTRIAKELGVDSIIASALLANLVSKSILKVSHMKVGGSPLYYIPGQEKELQNFSDRISGKEKDAYELIKQEKILKNDELEPAIRVAISHIKDFAKPISIMLKNNLEIKLWKWYLLDNEEATRIIREKYFKQSPQEKSQEKPVVKKIEQKRVESFQTQPPIKTKTEEAKEEQDALKRTEEKADKNSEKKNEEEKADTKEPNKPGEELFKKEIEHQAENIPPNIKKAAEERKLIIERYEKGKGKDAELTAHFEGFKKHKVFAFITQKKRINEKDIAMAYLKAQLKRLPLIIMHKGDFVKSAEELLKEMNIETIRI